MHVFRMLSLQPFRVLLLRVVAILDLWERQPMSQYPARYILMKVLLCAGLCASATALRAQVIVTHGPQIGSPNPITADPTVERPHTQPCTVQLFTNQAFADFSIKD